LADPGPDSPKQVIPAREAISNALRKASKFDEEVRYGVAVDDVYLVSHNGHYIYTTVIDVVTDRRFSASKRLSSICCFYYHPICEA
jgi:hypothetical protein